MQITWIIKHDFQCLSMPKHSTHETAIPNIRKSDFDGKTHCNTFGYPDHALGRPVH